MFLSLKRNNTTVKLDLRNLGCQETFIKKLFPKSILSQVVPPLVMGNQASECCPRVIQASAVIHTNQSQTAAELDNF